ncbi:MAG: polysaccharide biosynthesis tyrosine autokinase [Chloroflexota bacterium]
MYIYSSYQPVIYQTATRIMVSRAQDQESQVYSMYYDIQLAGSYAQLINTGPILDMLGEKLGYSVGKGQIGVNQVTNSQLIDLTVTDSVPQRAADIANNLVSVFMDYNNNLQSDRYQSIEQNLQAQIKQIEGQISTLQTEMANVTENTMETQQQQLDAQARQIEQLIAEADKEALEIELQISTYIPTPAVTNTPQPSWIIPTATPVPVPTPTLSASAEIQFREMQIRRDQLNQKRQLLQQAYGNLLLLKQDAKTDPALRQNQIQATLALYQQIYTGLLSNYENVRLARLRSTPTINQIEPAPVPTAPIQPQPARNAMVGGAAGLFLTAAIAFLIEYLDDTIKTTEDVHRHLKLPVLGLIGNMSAGKKKKDEDTEPGIFVLDNPLSPIAEGFRTLRANIEFASVDQPARIIEVTSASPSEGKSTVAANLAAIIAQGGKKVLLVDADFRRPYQHRILGVPNRKGLADLFRDPNLLPDVIQVIQQDEHSCLMAITTGELPPNPSELLASERMSQILARLAESADMVVLDTPPVILSDSVILASKIDGVLVVIKPGETRIGATTVMMEQLKRAGARVFGAVLNPVSPKTSHYYSKYNYYSSYYYKNSKYGYYNNYGRDGKNGKNGSGSNGERKSPIDVLKDKLG